MNKTLKNRIAITVGITGHRHLVVSDSVENALREQMAAMEAAFPETPFYGVSSLEEGAGRLFARLAVERGWELHVLLPFHRALCEQECKDEASRQELLSLCEAAETCREIEPVLPYKQRELEEKLFYRQLQYVKAGIVIAQTSHILMALWDGQKAKDFNDTAQIVHYKEKGDLDFTALSTCETISAHLKEALLPSHFLYQEERGLICRIHCERKASPGTRQISPDSEEDEITWSHCGLGSSANSLTGLSSADDGDGAFSALGNIVFNNKLLNQFSAQEAEPDHKTTPLLATELKTTREKLDRCVTLDTTARRRKIIMVFLAMASCLVFSNRDAHDPGFWLVFSKWSYLLVLLALVFLIIVLGWRNIKPEMIYRRALVEGMRIQDYWNILGIKEFVFNEYMNFEDKIMGSVRFSLKSSVFSRSKPHDFKDGLAAIQEDWIDDQIAYYKSKTDLIKKRQKRFSRLGKLAFVSAILSILITALETLSPLPYAGMIHLYERISGMLLGGSALLMTYTTFSGDAENLTDYTAALELFKQARSKMDELDRQYTQNGETSEEMLNDEFYQYEIRSILYDLGTAILNGEQARWVERSLKQKISLPIG